MLGRTAWVIVFGVLALAGCNNTTPPTTPTGASTTVTFTGSVNQSGAVTNSFATVTSGTVTATLTTVGPDVTKPIGFALGTFNTTASTCQIVLANDLALQGATLSAAASSAGTYCVRLYDTGFVVADTPSTFTVTVVHP
jgi:hypothetical protein